MFAGLFILLWVSGCWGSVCIMTYRFPPYRVVVVLVYAVDCKVGRRGRQGRECFDGVTIFSVKLSHPLFLSRCQPPRFPAHFISLLIIRLDPPGNRPAVGGWGCRLHAGQGVVGAVTYYKSNRGGLDDGSCLASCPAQFLHSKAPS